MAVFGLFKFAGNKKNHDQRPIRMDGQSGMNFSAPAGAAGGKEKVQPPPPVRNILEELLRQRDPTVAMELLKEITEEEQLAAVAYRCGLSSVALAAAEKIGRFELILKVLRNTEDKKIGKLLLEKISAQDELNTIASSALSRYLRRLTKEKLDTLPKTETTPATHEAEYSFAANREQIDAFEQLCLTLEKMAGRFDDAAITELAELQAQWQLLPQPPLRFMEILDKRFLMAVDDFKKRAEIARRKEQERQEAAARFDAWCGEAETLAETAWTPQVEARWRQLKTDWEHFAATFAPGEEHRHRYTAAGEKIAATATAALARREELRTRVQGWLDEIAAVSPEHLKDTTARMKEIRELLEHDDAIWAEELQGLPAQCRQALNHFFARLKEHYTAEEFDRCANLVRKQDLIKEAEALQSETSIPKIAGELKRLHLAWRQAGRAHRDEEEQLNSRFRELGDELHRRCDEYYEALRQERQANLEIKKQLAEEAESLRDSTDWHQTAERIKEMQLQWKQTGPGQKDEEPAVYQKFKDACDHFFVSRRQHIETLKEEWSQNAARKKELIKAAEELIGMDQRQAISRARELRQLWKQSPAADHRTEQSLWEEFNAKINSFFAELDTHQADNIAQKEDLCRQSAAFLLELEAMETIDYHRAARQAEDLLTAWKKSGPVPREKEVELWETFDAPLKKFYAMRQEFLRQLDEKRAAVLIEKNRLLENLEEILSQPGNPDEDAEKIKDLQRQWKEAGSAAPDQEKELWESFHGMCDDFFNRRKSTYEEHRRQQHENCRRKLELCVRIEKLAGIEAPADGRIGEFSLADELAMALQCRGNEVLDHHQAQEVCKAICEDWRQTGFSGKGESRLQQRFHRAREAFFRHRS